MKRVVKMDYRGLVENLKEIILPALEEENIELVELSFVKAGGRSILRLLVDKKGGGVNLQECARLNEKIGSLLDTQDVIKDRYILEVFSPGVDRPLVTKSDFLRCINRKVRFFLRESIDGKIELEGVIIKVEDDSVYIDIEGNHLQIPLSEITKAKQVVK